MAFRKLIFIISVFAVGYILIENYSPKSGSGPSPREKTTTSQKHDDSITVHIDNNQNQTFAQKFIGGIVAPIVESNIKKEIARHNIDKSMLNNDDLITSAFFYFTKQQPIIQFDSRKGAGGPIDPATAFLLEYQMWNMGGEPIALENTSSQVTLTQNTLPEGIRRALSQLHYGGETMALIPPSMMELPKNHPFGEAILPTEEIIIVRLAIQR